MIYCILFKDAPRIIQLIKFDFERVQIPNAKYIEVYSFFMVSFRLISISFFEIAVYVVAFSESYTPLEFKSIITEFNRII